MSQCCVFFFSSRRRHTRCSRDWSSDVCSSDLRGHSGSCRCGLEAARARCGGLEPGSSGRGDQVGGPGVHGAGPDRKSVVEGKRVDLGGRRIIKKKKKKEHVVCDYATAKSSGVL